MEITIVSDVIGEENNGTTIACMNLIRYLKSRGDHVKVLCADQFRKGQEDYFVVPNLNLGPLNLVLKANEVKLAKPNKKIILEALEGSDAVHIMLPFALGNAAMKICKEKNIPVTCGFHCQAENFTAHIFLMNNQFVNKFLYRRFYKTLYRYADAVHYPTEFIRNCFEQSIKHKTNAYVISNGVNDRYVRVENQNSVLNKDKFNILFIGRLSTEKSHPILLKAVSLSKYKDKIQLIFAGSGPKRNKIIRLSNKYGINTPKMNFYSRDELVKVINSADLYVHPSEIEIEAISALEAITCGLVPIFSDSPRSATKMFAIDDRNLFKYNSPQDLANKIDYWIEHPKEKEEMREKYLDFTNPFHQDVCMQRMREMIVETIEKKKNERKENN